MKTLKNKLIASFAVAMILLGITFIESCKKNEAPDSIKTNSLKKPGTSPERTLLTLPSTISEGLVAFWPFCRTGYDFSGNSHNGTSHNLSNTTDRFGNNYGAYAFNGNNGYESVPNAAALNLNNTDFTVNAWVKLTSYNTSYGSAIMNKHIAGNNNGWAWSVTGDSATTKFVQFFGPGGTSNNGYGRDTINTGQWHMLTVVYSLAYHSLRFYRDDVLDDTVGSIASPSALDTTMLYIGRDNPSSSANGYFFKGSMNDIRIYNRAITGSEMTTLYNATDAPTSGLLAYWPLTKTPDDFSGNAHNGTNHTISSGTDRFGNTIGAYSFNGTSSYIEADTAGLELNNTDFTVNAWVNLTSYNSSYGSAIMNRHLSGNNNGWAWSITGDSAATKKVQFFGPGGTANDAYASTVISLNTWHMVTCTYTLSTQTISFYVDGVFDKSVTGIASPNAYVTTQLYIGRDNPASSSNGYFFKGLLNDLRIYNRVITSTEISQLLTALD